MTVNVEQLYSEDLSKIEGTEYYDRIEHAAQVVNTVLEKADESKRDDMRETFIAEYQNCENAFKVHQLTQKLQEQHGTEIAFRSNRSSIELTHSGHFCSDGYFIHDFFDEEPAIAEIDFSLG